MDRKSWKVGARREKTAKNETTRAFPTILIVNGAPAPVNYRLPTNAICLGKSPAPLSFFAPAGAASRRCN
ncbi:MAG TPA: hypothetical protein VFE24_11345, partial [Pirellulales bacterium]|nr:hypothetical protein [Pirellulales bacterium]